MNINNLQKYNSSFTGGFRFKEVSPFMKSNLESLTKRGSKVFYDFEKQGDTFLLVPESMNNEVAINLKKVFAKNYKFYPNLTPKLIDTSKLLKIVLGSVNLYPLYNKTKSRLDSPLRHRLDAIKEMGYEVDVDNLMVRVYKGLTKINDLTNERQYVISPDNGKNILIKVLPHSKIDKIEYYTIDKKLGVIKEEMNTLDEMLKFNHEFSIRLKKYDGDFLKSSNFARTNLELVSEYASNNEEQELFFEHVTKEVPELAQKLCSDDLFVPNFQTYKLLLNSKAESQDEDLKAYKRYCQSGKITNNLC